MSTLRIFSKESEIRSNKVNRTIWLITAGFAFIAGLIGVINPDVYNKIVAETIIPGAFGQDLITILAASVLGYLAVSNQFFNFKKNIVGLGILGYLFYAYGIYVIERAYNPLYLLYMAIFGLSFWGIIYGLSTLHVPKLTIGKKAKRFSIGVALFQPVVFYPLWIMALLPLMMSGDQIDSLYSIYILDLVFIMPAFVMAAWMLRKKSNFAIYVMPAIFILGFTLIFSLAVSEVAKLYFDQTPLVGALLAALGLSSLFLVATFVHLKSVDEE